MNIKKAAKMVVHDYEKAKKEAQRLRGVMDAEHDENDKHFNRAVDEHGLLTDALEIVGAIREGHGFRPQVSGKLVEAIRKELNK